MKVTTSDIDGAIIGVRCVKNHNIRTGNFSLSLDDIEKIRSHNVERILIKAERGRKTLAVIHDINLALEHAKDKEDYFLISWRTYKPYSSNPGDE